jgi:hypothetical protein
MIPAVDVHLLPQNASELSRDAWLYSGALEGFRRLTKILTPTNPATQKAFRVPLNKLDAGRIPNSAWLEFQTTNVDVLKSPTVGDQFDRYYFAADNSPPRYNTKSRILNADSPLLLGVPAPSTAPGVSVVGGSGPTETRVYVYTWVTIYGEEGPPSPPTLFTGNSDGSWDITMTAPGGAGTDRLLDRVRIYRTVSGLSGETDYFFVAEQVVTDTTYSDTIVTVVGNPLLESLFWTPPPADLVGWVQMPNGIIAGWRKNEVWFCEPYRPHAWPVNYQLSLDAEVVGLGVIGQTVIAATVAAPYAISGINPASMAQSKLATLEPCTSRGSIVSTPMGVVYTSPNGLVLATPGGATTFSRQLMAKEDWSGLLYLPTVQGAEFNGGYYAFGSTAIGCFSDTGFDTDAFLQLDYSGAFKGGYFEPNDSRVAYTTLQSPVPVRSVYNDPWTDELFIMRDDGLFWLDQSTACRQPREAYLWRSKVFETPDNHNFSAMRVYFRTFPCSPDLNPVQNTSLVQTLAADQWGLIRVYCDGVLRFTRELRKSGEFFRLPSGFKATFWQIEVEARVQVLSIEIATQAAELKRV